MEEAKQENLVEGTVEISLEQAKELGLIGKPELRHTIIFHDDISIENVQQLIDELSNHFQVDLFFATAGGATVAMEALVHYLNYRKEDITVIITEELASAGTDILTDFKGKVVLSKELDFILFHQVDRVMPSIRKMPISRKELLNQLNESNKELVEKYIALGLNEKEIKKFNRGEDIIFYRKDFHRLNLNKSTEE